MPEPSNLHPDASDISVDVLIVGAGFSGLCMAIKLLEAGMKDFLLIEKSDDIGGTWTQTGENTTLWPGSVIRYIRTTRSVSPAEYDLKPAPPGQ